MCNLCNRTKLQYQRPFGELHPTETPEEQWDVISVDFIIKLPDSHGYNAIMNIVDSVSKRVHCIPTHTTISAEGAAQLFFQEVWKHHRLPRAVLSDQGPQFIAKFTHELYHILGIKLVISMAYHPQTDGQTEHFNQELEGYLRIFTTQCQDNWDNLLPSTKFTHNNHAHSSMQHTPFMINTGRHPRMGFEPQKAQSKLESVNEFTD
jgi:hypothetical protein